MASSRVMMSSRSSPSNQDPTRHNPDHHARTVGSMNVDDFLTLEDYLAKAGAMPVENDVTVPMDDVSPAAAGYTNSNGMEMMILNNTDTNTNSNNITNSNNSYEASESKNVLGYAGNGHVAVRGKRRVVVEEAVMDKATQQKQRRMIKNRESAARSRERKQAYTVELESLVTQLEEENARLLRQEEELNKERYIQLMENLIPVTEKGRPPRVLRRVRSMEW